MAEKTSPLASMPRPVPGEGDDEAMQAYTAALDKITAALEARENPVFDPTWLGIARGLLRPTQSGRFGESLGNAMEMAQSAYDANQKQVIENAQMRMQLAQAKMTQANQRKALDLAFGPGSVSVGGVNAPAEGQAPQEGMNKSITINGQQFPANFINMTPEKAFLIGRYDPELGKAASEFLKLRMEGFKVQPGGYVDVTGAQPVYTPFGGKALVERFVPADPASGRSAMNIKMPEEAAILFDRALDKGDAATYNKIVDRFTKPISATAAPAAAAGTAGAPAAAPGAPAAATGATSVRKPSVAQTPEQLKAEQEIETARQKVTAEERAKGEAKRFENIVNSAEDAGSRIGMYKALSAIVNKPGSEKLFGIFNRPDFMASVGKLVESGIGVPGFSIGVPEIQNIMRNIGLPQEQINDYQLAASLMAQVQMQASQLQKGQGSVSDFERRLYGMASSTPEDNPQTISRKMAMLTKRAEFERSVSRALRKSGMDADTFKDSDTYQNLLNQYHQDLVSIVSPGSRQATAGSAAPLPALPASRAAWEAEMQRRKTAGQK